MKRTLSEANNQIFQGRHIIYKHDTIGKNNISALKI